MERHKQAVSEIAASVRTCFDKNEPYRIFHGSTNSTRPRPRPGAAPTVDISSLCHVVGVDGAARTALVEPNVPMDRLVEATLRHGLVPPVVMEFPGITAGGGYAGTAGESSSFRHGFFSDTINQVEMVLGNGDVVRASATERPDLFRGAAGALGTLGLTTLVEVRLVEARRWVRATYHRAGSVAEAVERVRGETRNPANDYVDGILFSPEHGVVVAGAMTDEKPEGVRPRTFSRARDPWFYLHARDRTRGPGASSSSSTPAVDYIPLAEYLFRYDRAGFWVARSAWTSFRCLPFNRLTRWLLDDLAHTRMLYRSLHASGESAHFLVQDLALPYASACPFVDYAAASLGIWPLWLCPLRQTPPPTFHPYTGETEATTTTSTSTTAATTPSDMLNIGLWGWGPPTHAAFVAKNRALEDRLVDLGGRKWLYAHTYYDEDQFWRVYAENRPWYQRLREKYHATTLPTVHQKVRVDVDAARGDRHRALGLLYGAWQAIRSKDYLLHRHAEWKYKGEE